MEGTSPVGWLCLVPPLLTIFLAIASRQVVASLLIGIASAIAILLPSPAAYQKITGEEFQWLPYLQDTAGSFFHSLSETYLWASLTDPGHLRIFAFTMMLGMQVALIHRCGGMLGIVAWLGPLAKSRRSGQVLTWLLGLVIFIDDYANTLLLGSTMQPVADRLKISREKLAFLVDTTAAPVAGLALVSTWVAAEISSMQAGFTDAGIEIGASTFGIFLKTIPTRFYVLYALFFVLACAWMCRDFGPMLAAERRRMEEEDDLEETPSAVPQATSKVKPRGINAILPISVTVVVAVWLLILTGQQKLGDTPLSDSTLQAWGEIIGQGDSPVALFYGGIAGLAVVLGLAFSQRELTPPEIRGGFLQGFLHVLPAMIILWLAWTLSKLTGNDHMRTGSFIAQQFTALNLSAAFMPTIVFLLACVIAFSTGTSWGTMAILMPIVIPLVYGLLTQQTGSPPAPDHFLMTASIGSVLAGAIFGDHCSPISDTTILSSRSSGCDHIAHVRTQMPYALTIGGVSILFGTLPAGFGWSSWLLLPAGMISIVVVLRLLGTSTKSAAY